MKVFIAIPILGSLVIFQSAVLNYFPLLYGTADLVLITIIAWALQKNVNSAWQWGIIGALLVGFVSQIPYIVTIIGYSIAVGVALALRQRIWQVPVLAMLVTVFLGSLFVNTVTMISLRLQDTPIPLMQSLNLIVIPSIILNLLFSIPLYVLFSDLAKWLHPRELEM